MTSLFRRLGVDYGQWKALVRTAVRIDVRATTMGSRHRGSNRNLRSLVIQVGFYFMMGILIAVLIAPIRQVFLSGLIVVSYVMFMVGTVALLEHNAMIVSPDDYAILGFRPVGSRTYFAARFTNVLLFTTAITTLFSVVPLTALFLRWGPLVGLAAVAAVYGASTLTALVMVVIYAALLQALGPRRLRTGLSYLQMLLSFAVYGGYFLLAQVASTDSRAAFHLEKTAALLAAPPTWFASYLDLAAGHRTAMEAVPAAASILALIVVSAFLGGRLSLEYANRLGALTTVRSSGRPARRSRRPAVPFFTRGEARAVALLVGSQFRNDLKFRMGVLAILPLTVIYLVMGIRQWGGRNPFASDDVATNLSMVTIAMLMFPILLKMQLTRSDSYRASWIYFACPTDRTRMVRSATEILTVMFLVPYLVLVGLVLAWFTRNDPYVLLYLVVVGLVSRLLLQIETVVDPELPFSKPVQRGSAVSRFLFVMIAIGVAGALLPLLGPILVGNAMGGAAVVAVLLLASLGVDRWMRRRVERLARKLEFEGG